MIPILPWQRSTLQALLARRSTLPHALLIHGRAGIGKVEFGHALAQSLLCESPQETIACGECAACKWFADGNHPDYRQLLPEALADDDVSVETVEPDADAKDKKKSREIKIEQVRAVGDFMTLSTHRDGFRVLLIHPAEALNLAAANALLKTLEEPPARTAIILVADQLGRLLATIRSRCQKVLLPTPATEVAVAWLTSQNVVDADAALAAAGGAPLDAIAYAGREYRSQRDAFVTLLSSSPLDFVAGGQSFEKSDLNHVILWIQTWVSDLLLQKTTGSVRYFERDIRVLAAIANRADAARLFRFEAELRQTRRLVNHPLNPRLFLEQLLISYAQSIRP